MDATQEEMRVAESLVKIDFFLEEMDRYIEYGEDEL